MYNEDEKKKLSKATIKLLQKSIKDIRADDANTPSVLLTLHNFTKTAWNDHKKGRNLMTLIMAGMWNMFDKEVGR